MTAPPLGRASTGQMICWAMYDWANSSFSAVIQTFVFAAYFARFVAPDETSGAAWWGYTIGGAGLVVAITGPILGAIADQSGRRKPWIATFTALAVVTTGLLWFVRPRGEDVLLALLLVGVGTVGSELAVLFYNAMLPALAHPSRIGRWSGWAWGAGYIGGLACLVIALMVFIRPDIFGGAGGEARSTRAVFILVAVWYGLFSLPLLLWTPDEPRSSQPMDRRVRDGCRQLIDSLRHLRRHGPIVRFLIAHMLYVDALVTLFAFGGIYAASVFGFDTQEVLMLGIALNLTAGIGAAAFGWIDDYLGSRRTILLSLTALIICTAAILLVPGVTGVAAFWTIALVLGVFVGPVQAASRSYLSRVAPPELRNEMFGLYALAGKATAFAGPLLVGIVTQLSGSQRIGMSIIVVLMVAGGVLMYTVPPAAAAERSVE